MASLKEWTIIWCAMAIYCADSVAGGVHFSSISNTLTVNATVHGNSSSPNGVAKAGADELAVTWRLNGSVPAWTAAGYARVKVKLCFCPVSQVDRPWRKTDDDLAKDKTCQFDVAERAYSDGAVTWRVAENVAGASYFVRAYALDTSGREVAYGETSRGDGDHLEGVLVVEPISGRHLSLLVATLCFSILSVLALPAFFVVEKLAAKKLIAKSASLVNLPTA